MAELPKAICDCCNLLTNEFFKQAVQIEIDAGRQPMSLRVKQNLAKLQKLPDEQGLMHCGSCDNDITDAINTYLIEVKDAPKQNQSQLTNE